MLAILEKPLAPRKPRRINRRRSISPQPHTQINLLPVEVAVDANRNGEVEFGTDRTSAAKPYRFWINNDSDIALNSEDSSGDPDHGDGSIITIRDLEDFTRIQLMVGGLHEQLKNGEIQVTMKFKDGTTEGDPKINLTWHRDEEGDLDYIRDDSNAVRQSNQLLGSVSKDSGHAFDKGFWTGEDIPNYSGITSTKPHRYLLFEGASKGKGELVLEFKKGDEVLGEACSCWIHLLDVREMYERIKITPDDPDDFTPNPDHQPGWDHPANPDDYVHPRDFHLRESDPPNILPPVAEIGYVADPNGKPFVPDPNEEEEYIVFVHGWNMTYTDSQKYGETMFKRLWAAGYKGRYSFVRWATYSTDTHPNFITNKLTYNDSDYRAWLSGKGLAQYVNSLDTKYGRHVVAHSMGNVVASSALREGMFVENYALLNAAIPAMCFDTDDNLHTFFGDVRTADDDDGPITSALGFEGIIDPPYGPRLINFYLPDDSALFAWRPNNILLKPLRSFTFKYGYNGAAADGERQRITHHAADLIGAQTHPTRFIRSFYESVAYCTFSKTKTAGADGRTAGSISDSLNMNEEYGFDTTHSAEWQWRIQKTNKFYRDLMSKFDLEPNF
jgi:hypothetical protein